MEVALDRPPIRTLPTPLPPSEFLDSGLPSPEDSCVLPPLPPGLPGTPTDNCKALILAVIYQAIQEQDLHWVASDKFTLYGVLAGLEIDEVFAIRRAVLSGLYKPRLLSGIKWLSEETRYAGV